jgi:L-ascorbate metabolism protein UlaG (beta-lactamase superfamily)
MDIIWHGQSCFSIRTKNCTAVVDPYSPEIGLTLPKLKADMVLISRDLPSHNNAKAVDGEKKVIEWPGEYEIKGVAINAQKVPAEEGKKEIRFFTVNADGILICFLGDIGKGLDEQLIESIGNVDVLLLPVGGHDVLDAKAAHAVVEELEPRVVIPMHYAVDGLKENYDGVDAFLKLTGASVEPRDKFTVTQRSELPAEKTDYVVLRPQTA